MRDELVDQVRYFAWRCGIEGRSVPLRTVCAFKAIAEFDRRGADERWPFLKDDMPDHAGAASANILGARQALGRNRALGERAAMSWRSRVVWTEGLFLRPHTFSRAIDTSRASSRADAHVTPYPWGFSVLEIDSRPRAAE